MKYTWKEVLFSMLLALSVHLYMISPTTQSNTAKLLISRMASLKKLWEHQLTLTTFVLTFFTSQAFSYWQTVYQTTRMIQGRINDVCMLVAVGAKRGRKHGSEALNDDDGTINKREDGENKDVHNDKDVKEGNKRYMKEKSKSMVLNATRLLRMSHIFFWAATPTASNGLSDCEKFIEDSEKCPLPFDELTIGPLLLSSYGLRVLMESGQLTKAEVRDLTMSRLPPSQYAYILLVWASLRIVKGFEDGTMRNSPGLEENILRQLTSLRASMFDIDDMRAGRMPLAYVHLVQVLVDSLVVVAPFALYPEIGILSIPLVALLTLFFRGLLSLSKSFLDPFGVEGFVGQNIRVDVLVSEINFGAGQRWYNAARRLPLDGNDGR